MAPLDGDLLLCPTEVRVRRAVCRHSCFTVIENDMPVTLLCPRLSCRAILRVPDNVRGKRVRCGECGTAFLVPTSADKQSKGKTAPAKTAAPG